MLLRNRGAEIAEIPQAISRQKPSCRAAKVLSVPPNRLRFPLLAPPPKDLQSIFHKCKIGFMNAAAAGLRMMTRPFRLNLSQRRRLRGLQVCRALKKDDDARVTPTVQKSLNLPTLNHTRICKPSFRVDFCFSLPSHWRIKRLYTGWVKRNVQATDGSEFSNKLKLYYYRLCYFLALNSQFQQPCRLSLDIMLYQTDNVYASRNGKYYLLRRDLTCKQRHWHASCSKPCKLLVLKPGGIQKGR